MTPLDAALLGLVQGLTEFLPVSSSGHLVLTASLLGLEPNLLFDVLVHLATLIATLVYYREDVLSVVRALIAAPSKGIAESWTDDSFRLAAYVVVASVPTAIMGLGLKDLIETHLATPRYVALFLCLTGVLLALTLVKRKTTDLVRLSLGSALILGIVQGCAILPGISRSGSTIAIALVLGIAGKEAARFSFLMALPAIGGATLLSMLKLNAANLSVFSTSVGFAAAGISGWLALRWFIPLVERGKLHIFAPYVWALALGTWFWMS